MLLSVIVPCYNEEENIEEFNRVLKKELKNIDYETIYINDGSSDNTIAELLNIYHRDSDNKVKIIDFSRNFKKDAAIYAGLQYSSGDYCVIIDADLQQDPIYITKGLKFLKEHKEYDQVAFINKKRKEKKTAIFFKNVWYKLIDYLSDVHFINGASDFRIIKRKVADSILEIAEFNRFTKGIFAWVGFRTYAMDYEVKERKKGQSKFNLKNNFKYAFDGIIGFSTKPLKLATYCGVISSIIAFILLIEVLIEKIFFHNPIAGYSTIMCAILFLGGIQLITIGILGDYLAKSYMEVKKKTNIYRKRKIWN